MDYLFPFVLLSYSSREVYEAPTKSLPWRGVMLFYVNIICKRTTLSSLGVCPIGVFFEEAFGGRGDCGWAAKRRMSPKVLFDFPQHNFLSSFKIALRNTDDQAKKRCLEACI